ncbi:proprotein convertase subtilisin/kexin type 4-like protein [Cricetulus griseus]|uniref:Proprotein convertase subtilisin/kexin type 4-like protein n=1 Tax=Cricetulus griseus TaxID=10029 RepID=A0A061HZX2_CRIGR|nr:proprotein convertase subtilisin/kexin type 4-like protein [Cricetulus griseus]
MPLSITFPDLSRRPLFPSTAPGCGSAVPDPPLGPPSAPEERAQGAVTALAPVYTPHPGDRDCSSLCPPQVQWFEQQTLRRRVKRSLVVPTDPWFSKQWYMNNEIQPDLNILKVWNQGLTGRGVVVSILDDGIEKDHPDLWANYDPLASYDFNDYDPDPQPRYTPSDENRHGTRCAGEVSATANNGFCGAGVAFNARIGGVRMLDGTITDIVEAQSLSLQPQHIHIYSASWGPEDDGRTVDGPGILTREAFRRGVTKVHRERTLGGGRRGDLEIALTSPMGTRSTLVAIRPLDISGQGYNNWIFMSTHYWDEDPQGLWTLGLENKGYYFNTGTLYYYTLLLYGTAEDMTARPQGPQVTSRACVQRDTEGLRQESHIPPAILAWLCLISSRQWWLYSHTEQPVTEGQASCHPPITPAGAA